MNANVFVYEKKRIYKHLPFGFLRILNLYISFSFKHLNRYFLYTLLVVVIIFKND